MSKLSIDQVKHIAKLGNLTLSEQELEKFADQLTETLTYVEQLESVDTKGVEPTSQVTGLVNITRVDEVVPSLSQEEALQGIDSKQDNFFKVSAVLEGS